MGVKTTGQALENQAFEVGSQKSEVKGPGGRAKRALFPTSDFRLLTSENQQPSGGLPRGGLFPTQAASGLRRRSVQVPAAKSGARLFGVLQLHKLVFNLQLHFLKMMDHHVIGVRSTLLFGDLRVQISVLRLEGFLMRGDCHGRISFPLLATEGLLAHFSGRYPRKMINRI